MYSKLDRPRESPSEIAKKGGTIDTAEEARQTTPKHEFVYLHDVGRLRELLKQNPCIENIRGCGH